MLYFRYLRATAAQLNQMAPDAGQLVVNTTTNQLFIGDGSLLGGHLVGLGQEAIEQLLHNSFDVLAIETIQGLTQALAAKADADDLAAIEAGLDNLATEETLDDLSIDVANKASQAQLTAKVDAKADQSVLDQLATRLTTKAGTSELTTALSNKADASALAALDIEVDNKQDSQALTTAVAKKADQSALNTLKTTTATKAKQTDLANLKTVTDGKMATSTLTTELNKKVAKTDLFTNGLINSSLLPSSVDDVLEFANLAAFPATGEKGKIYVTRDTALVYRWSGSAYIRLQQPIAQVIATQAQAEALAERQVYMSPKRLSDVITMVGFTKDTDGKWLLNEGDLAFAGMIGKLAARAAMSVSLHGVASCEFNGKIYLFGGNNGTAPQNGFYSYDPATNQYKTLKVGPSVRHFANLRGYNGALYLFGGANSSTALGDLWKYDIASDTWTQVTASTGITRYLSFAEIVNGILYIGNGSGSAGGNTAEWFNDFWAYDLTKKTMTQKTAPGVNNNTSVARQQNMSLAFNGKIYACGGVSRVGGQTGTAVYDPTKDQWTQLALLPKGVGGGAFFKAGDDLYLYGGMDTTSTFVDTLYRYRMAKNTWELVTNVSMKWAQGAYGAVDNKLYLIDGFQDTVRSNKAYVMT